MLRLGSQPLPLLQRSRAKKFLYECLKRLESDHSGTGANTLAM